MDIDKTFWPRSADDLLYSAYTNSEGSLVIKLTFTLKGLPEIRTSIAKAFQKACKDEFTQNLVALLNDQISCDVKIVTKDQIELPAHKLILCGNKTNSLLNT